MNFSTENVKSNPYFFYKGESMKLSLRQKFILFFKGSVFVGYEQREGWTKPKKIFLCKCSKHGLYTGPLHGWNDQPPQCPKCIKEFAEQVKKIQDKQPSVIAI
jgi:hypothetical protein